MRDTTEAALPGVTVEVSSPALIEKVRTAVTDGQGNYRIVDLRPSTYTVTFTLAGFATLRREGVLVTTGVTTNVSGHMTVSSLEETIIVTSESPVVDVQNVRKVDVLSREVLDALPTSKMLQSYAALTLGASMTLPGNQDVGGNQGEAAGFGYFGVHGGRATDGRVKLDGMLFYALIGSMTAGNGSTFVNSMAIEETTIETRGAGPEAETGGVQTNVVPRTGGNAFAASVIVNGTSGRFQSDNLDDALRARGLTNTANVKALYDQGVGLGGPILRDRLWFFTAHRRWGTQNYQAGKFFNLTPNEPRYTPDRSRQMYTWLHNRDDQGRITWQINQKQRLDVSIGFQGNANELWGADAATLVSPEATTRLTWSPSVLTQATWRYTLTNRLLIEAAVTGLYERQVNVVNAVADVTSTSIPWRELSTSTSWGARADGLFGVDYGEQNKSQMNSRYAISYTTGSHAAKVGMTWLYGWPYLTTDLNVVPGLGPVRLDLLGGTPNQITQFRTPHTAKTRPFMLGIFAGDQWTVGRVTLNLGVRYDNLRASVSPTHLDAVRIAGQSQDYAPALDFPAVENVPLWNDVSPRFGAAWDVFGSGRTAIKGSFGRYTETEAIGIAGSNAPMNTIAATTSRTWTDDGNFFPDCDLSILVANGECGALRNPAFGLPRAVTTWDPEYLKGWTIRPYSWQGTLTLQHELQPRMALNAGYYFTTYRNFRTTINRALSNSDFDSYCITAPVDPRLRSASGQVFCGYVDQRILPVPDNFVTSASNVQSPSETYNGVDVGLQYRLGAGGLLRGGISAGRQIIDTCNLINADLTVAATIAPSRAASGNIPRGAGNEAFCRESRDWAEQLQAKIQGSYPLPYGFQVAGTLQSLPGIPLYAQVNAPRVVGTTLGRGLSSGSANLAVFEPWTEFEDRLLQVDVRLAKWFTFRRVRIQGQLDVYNLTNANTVLATQNSFDPATERLLGAFHQPTSILGGRLIKFGVQIEFK